MSSSGLILASASTGRLGLLTRAGVDPVVRVSHVDEEALAARLPVRELAPDRLPQRLAEAKCIDVAARSTDLPSHVIIGCDSMFEFGGRILGKPRDRDDAVERLREMSGSSGVLHTGHALMRSHDEAPVVALASTEVVFEPFTEDDLQAYIDTEEPLAVAGSFTLDGLGGPFITSVSGDPSNVVGLSLPLVRRLLEEHFGMRWASLWRGTA